MLGKKTEMGSCLVCHKFDNRSVKSRSKSGQAQANMPISVSLFFQSTNTT